MKTYQFIKAPKRRRQNGIAAISLALLLLIFAGMMLAGQYFISRATDAKVIVEEQLLAVQWAEDAINSFAAVYGRLPCPASNRDDKEDCGDSAKAKGWLPIKTIGDFGSDSPDFLSTRYRPDIHYGVYRGSDDTADKGASNLTIASDVFVPKLASGNKVSDYPGAGSDSVVSGLDLCTKLRGIFPEPKNRWELAQQLSGGLPEKKEATNLRRTYINYPEATDQVLPVAYAIAVAAKGAPTKASLLNADISTPQFERPDRQHSAQYSDFVKVVDVHSLYKSMGCAATMASIDMLADAQSWTDIATAQKNSNENISTEIRAAQAVFAVAGGLSVVNAGLSTQSAIDLFTTNTSNLAQAFSTLNLIAVNSYTLGIANATTALAVAIEDTVFSSISEVLSLTTIAVYTAESIVAANKQVWQGGKERLIKADKQGTGDEQE